ncbi:coil containing protein [Vibrio phage 1.167.O._10N.261.51.F2]|nr:coil containing protein [Vibrio phage 1.167.O._10N.261.51.F2]
MNDKLYAERDIEILDDKGDYYFNHIFAMTGEGLHSKSDIAAELGYRDMRIDELKADKAELLEELESMLWDSDCVLCIESTSRIEGLIDQHKENK